MTDVVSELPPEWLALGGDWIAEVDRAWMLDAYQVRVVHRLLTLRVGSMEVISAELWGDHAAKILPVVFRGMDHYFRPWLYYRRPTLIRFDPFPRWSRFRRRLRRWQP